MYTIEGIDYAHEGLCLLNMMATGGSERWCEEIRSRQSRCDLSALPLDALMDAVRRAEKVVSVPAELLKRDFRPLEDDADMNLAHACVQLTQCRARAGSMGEREQRTREYLARLVELENQKPLSNEEVIALLAQTQASDKLKWFCVEAMNDAARRAQPTLDAIAQAETALMDEAAVLEPMAEQCVAQLLQAWTRDGYEAHLERVGIRLDEQPVSVYPSPINCFALQVSEKTPLYEDGLVEYIGICVETIASHNERREWSDEALYRMVHAMDDKNRMLILSLLREGPKIGRELCQGTKLTPATISHHMNELFHSGLVLVEKQGNSIEYRLCAANMEQGLRQLLERFCEKSE